MADVIFLRILRLAPNTISKYRSHSCRVVEMRIILSRSLGGTAKGLSSGRSKMSIGSCSYLHVWKSLHTLCLAEQTRGVDQAMSNPKPPVLYMPGLTAVSCRCPSASLNSRGSLHSNMHWGIKEGALAGHLTVQYTVEQKMMTDRHDYTPIGMVHTSTVSSSISPAWCNSMPETQIRKQEIEWRIKRMKMEIIKNGSKI